MQRLPRMILKGNIATNWIYELVDQNYDKIKAAENTCFKIQPGIILWNIWDRETGVLTLHQLFVDWEHLA